MITLGICSRNSHTKRVSHRSEYHVLTCSGYTIFSFWFTPPATGRSETFEEVLRENILLLDAHYEKQNEKVEVKEEKSETKAEPETKPEPKAEPNSEQEQLTPVANAQETTDTVVPKPKAKTPAAQSKKEPKPAPKDNSAFTYGALGLTLVILGYGLFTYFKHKN